MYLISPARKARPAARQVLGAERRLPAVVQAQVHVTAGPGLAGQRPGHERDRAAAGLGDGLHPMLVDHVPVGHRHRRGIPQVDLVLAGPSLTLPLVDRDADAVHGPAHGGDELAVEPGHQDVVVGVPVIGGAQVAVAGFPGRRVRRAEQIELQLGRDRRGQAGAGQAVGLAGQDRPGCLRGALPAVARHVGQHQGCSWLPARPAERAQVGAEQAVRKAAVHPGDGEPVRRGVLYAGDEVKIGHRQPVRQHRRPA